MYSSLHGNQAEGYTFGAPALGKRMPKYVTSATFTKTCQLMHTFLAAPPHTAPWGVGRGLSMQTRDPEGSPEAYVSLTS